MNMDTVNKITMAYSAMGGATFAVIQQRYGKGTLGDTLENIFLGALWPVTLPLFVASHVLYQNRKRKETPPQ